MKYSKEMVEKAKPASLRLAIESELNAAFYRGYDRNEKEIKAEAEKVGALYDVAQLFSDFSKLLQKYPDIHVTQIAQGIMLSGQPKVSSRAVDTVSKLNFYCHDALYVRIVEDEELEAKCQQLELIDNLSACAIFQILLWVQNDDDLKACYLEFIDLIQPYHDMLVEKKNRFLSTLTTGITEILQDIPREKTAAMPVTLNIPLLMYRLKQEVDNYHLEESLYGIDESAMALVVTKGPDRYSIGMDYATMNGVMFYFRVKGKLNIDVLGAEPLKQLIKKLVPKLKQSGDLYGRLFAEKIVEVLYELVYWEDNDTEKSEQEKCKRLFG